MRRSVADQLPLSPANVAHPHARELDEIARILDEEPRLSELVTEDLLRDGQRADHGREGMSGRQVLTALLLKQTTGASYDRLAFHLADSTSYRRLMQLGMSDKGPSKSTLHENIRQVRPETLEQINRVLMGHAEAQGMETAEQVSSDCTTIDVAIHHPTDSSLVWDAVRVLTRSREPGLTAACRFRTTAGGRSGGRWGSRTRSRCGSDARCIASC
jgi:IS5 family transposase